MQSTEKQQRWVGIDPGQKGALVAIGDDYYSAIVMPLIGKEVDAKAVAEWLFEQQPTFVVIEKVGARPKQGTVSMFNFGRGVGEIVGVLKSDGHPYREVTPQMWKSLVLAGTPRDKEAAIKHVAARYPDIELIPPRCRKQHDGIADAACMAEYAKRTF